MKNISKLIILLLSISVLFGCDILGDRGENKDYGDGAKMIAEIVYISDKIEVNVIEGDYGASGAYWVITNSATVIKDQNNNHISTLNVGDKIEIIYSGQVMLSYPPQIVAKKIIVLK